ncbi:MAG: alpha/beta hydrolase [Verrucomicrobia bacterium]|nr:alpha/beta hydrolase [Verrucomicrobiota bacterium]
MGIQEITIKRLILATAKISGRVCLGLFALLTVLAMSGCANFKILGRNLDFMDESYILSVKIANAKGVKNLKGAVVEWNQRPGEVLSGDYAAVNNPVGTFGFFVRTSKNQFVMAYSDINGNDFYDEGEPAWIHSDADGSPVPVVFNENERKARMVGELSESTIISKRLIADVKKFAAGRSRAEIISRLNIPIALGDIANLSDPRFSSERGEQGLWQPADFPVDSGIGIYFLEEYDPNRIPVLFVYGAGGSPQDWRTFFDKIDRKKYQPWFYFYPTGRRLDEMGGALNRGVETLQDFYGFKRLHVVAHSMGGMVARSFITKNVLDGGNRYITKFVTISTPWGGHEAAEAGVKHAPEVVPSWRDMAAGSDFQKNLYARSLEGKVEHFLIYGNKGKKSMILPPENDGTVSVASQRHAPVLKASVYFKSFYSDHVGILSNPEVIELTQRFLDAK